MKGMKRELKVKEEKCTYCQICQLSCSYLYTGRFNPSQAKIKLEWNDGAKITFTEDCNICGECARSCLYGAILAEGARP